MWKILFLLCNFSVVLMGERSRFINVTCSTSGSGTFNNVICFVKNGLLTAEGTLTRLLINVKTDHKIFFKTGNTYRQIFKFPPIDMCSYINGNRGKNPNPFAKAIVDYLRIYAPQAVKKCPWTGVLGASNLSLDNSKLEVLIPTGYYRHIIAYSDDKDKNIFTVDYFCMISTLMKFNN